jgi:hypothetical protein
LRFIARTSNPPTLRAVFLEDAAALAGIVIAALGEPNPVEDHASGGGQALRSPRRDRTHRF